MDEKKTSVRFSPVYLKYVKFERSDSIDDKTYRIDVSDTITISEVNDNSFKVEFVRKTVTKVPFFVEVCFDFVVSLDETGVDYYKGDLERIQNFAELRKNEIVNNLNLPSRASLLIGNVVKEIGTPFISVPHVIIKEQNK